MEIIQEKINQLTQEKEKQEINKLELTNNINNKLKIFEEIKIILKNQNVEEEKDLEKFSDLKQILNEYHAIDGFEKHYTDFVNVLKYKFVSKLDIPFGAKIESFIKMLEDKIQQIEKEVQVQLNQIKSQTNSSIDIDIVNLKKINKIISEEEKTEYVTEDMLSSLVKNFDIINLTNISKEDSMKLISLLYQIKNLKKQDKKEIITEDKQETINEEKEQEIEDRKPATKEEIFELIDKYVTGKYNKSIKEIIDPIKEKTDKKEDIDQKEIQKEEILNSFDLKNAEEILNYFKEQNIINNFSATSLIGIITYSNLEIVTDTYNKIIEESSKMNEKMKEKYINMFFQDSMKSVWIKSNNNKKTWKNQFRKSKHSVIERTHQIKTIGEECNEGISLEEFFETRKILEESQDILSIKYRRDRYGEILSFLSINPSILGKNLKLCKIFKLSEYSKIPYSCISKSDIEDKIHMAIELGLLKSPMNDEFKKMDDSINKNGVFQTNMLSKGIENHSIRQYYQRFLSIIAVTAIQDFATLAKKLNDEGFVDFYNYFFSEKSAGLADRNKLLEDFKKSDETIYNEFKIETNEEYENVINNDETFYSYDKELFNDSLIKMLEEKYSIMDKLKIGNKTVEVQNEFVYYIEGKIISRQRVLNTAQKLINYYKELDMDMLLYAITRNSLMPNDKYDKIKETLERSIQNGLSKTI